MLIFVCRLTFMITIAVCEIAFADLCAFLFRSELPWNREPGFINVAKPGTADLDHPFIEVMVEGGRNSIHEKNQKVDFHAAAPGHFLETVVLRTNYASQLPRAFAQSVTKLVTSAQVKAMTDMDLDPKKLRRTIRIALGRLYMRYKRQGPERSENIRTYQKEDDRGAKRTTHFLQIVNGEEVAHIQVQSSYQPHFEPLNLETHFDVHGIIQRAPGERVFEVGRFELRKESELNKKTLEIMNAMGIDRRILFMRTLQKVTSWLNHDLRAERVFFQVNNQVLRILEEAFAPVNIPIRYAVKASETAPTEWVVELKQKTLMRLEEQLLRKTIRHYLEKDIEVMRENEAPTNLAWHWTFWPNEFEGIQRLHEGMQSIRNQGHPELANFLATIQSCTLCGRDYIMSHWDSTYPEILSKFRNKYMLSLDYNYANGLVNHPPLQ